MHPQSQPSYHAQSHCWLLEIKAPENKWMKNHHMIKNKLFTSSSQKKKKRSEGWVLEIYPSTVNWRANVKSIGLCISVSVVGEWVLWVVNVMGISLNSLSRKQMNERWNILKIWATKSLTTQIKVKSLSIRQFLTVMFVHCFGPCTYYCSKQIYMTEDTTLPPQTYTARTLSSLFSLFFSILQILAVGLFVLEQGKTGVCVLKLGLTGHSSCVLVLYS